jgi:hypothetical protein
MKAATIIALHPEHKKKETMPLQPPASGSKAESPIQTLLDCKQL